jgi:hypothetical protein
VRQREVLQLIATAVLVMGVGLVLLVGLHVLVTRGPVLHDGTFWDGLLHGATAPLGAVDWLLGRGPLKDFASGWGYEVGFHAAAVGMLATWQTLLQIRTHRATGRRHVLERPVLVATGSVWSGALLLGLAFGTWERPESVVPPLFGLVPGAWRHAAMALLALLVGLSMGLLVLEALARAARSRT